ncbi:MAG: hypothetical protein LBV74_01080 [Tannerella sp.]|jgi:hypothetical protein|nr:hypothetical protein [Tannerella sp.]
MKFPVITHITGRLRLLAAYLITLNFLFSCAGLTIGEDAPVWAILFVVAWFIVSTLLMRWAYRRRMLGMLNRIIEDMQ